MTHDWITLSGIGVDIIVTLVGFVKIAINYEHRFTKLETEMMLILQTVLKDKGKINEK